MDEPEQKKHTVEKTTKPPARRGRPPKVAPTPRDVPAEWTPAEAMTEEQRSAPPPKVEFREPPVIARESVREAFEDTPQAQPRVPAHEPPVQEVPAVAAAGEPSAGGVQERREVHEPHRPHDRGPRHAPDRFNNRHPRKPYNPHHGHNGHPRQGGQDFRQNQRFEMRRLSRRERMMLRRQDDPYQPQQEDVAGHASDGPAVSVSALQAMEMSLLLNQAEAFGIMGEIAHLRKSEVIFEVLRAHARRGGVVMAEGILEMLPDGVGFLRSVCNCYRSSPEDACVLPAIIRRFGLRSGDAVSGIARAPRDPKDRYFTLVNVDKLNGDKPEANRRTPFFELLPVMLPEVRLTVETVSEELSTRMVDLVAPLGFGQRALITAPSGSGALKLLQKMANAVVEKHPQAEVMVVLLGDRPEDIAEMTAQTKATVLGIALDELPDQSAQVAEIAVEMARRKVENGKNVVILLDSLTHLSEAYLALQPAVIRNTQSLDSGVWFKIKRLFGAARAVAGGGSLTMVATVIPDELTLAHQQLVTRLRGICNAEIVLDAALAERGIVPAIHIEQSRSFRNERLLPPDVLVRTQVLRRALSGLSPAESLEMILKKMKNSASNADFLMSLKDNV